MKFAVCDDEPFMLEEVSARLSNYMSQRGLSCRILCFPDGKSLLESGCDFDVLFLDIQMRVPDGMETAGLLRKQGYQGLLVFITVLKECVFDSFEVQAFDYLLKPLNDERFNRTMERILQTLMQKEEKSILVQKGGSCQVILFSQIMYCEVFGRKIYLHRQDCETIDYYSRLQDLEKRLDSRFFRCHRSYLVNLDYVRGCAGGLVSLPDGNQIPVSRLREKELVQALMFHMKGRGM